ncbi:MAG: hypothetical protein ACP5QO_14875 [Clostridia bacterium]
MRGILRPGQLVVLESTTYPGTTEEVLRPVLETSGLTVGNALFIAHSLERVDPGNPVYQTRNTPKLVGGSTPVSGSASACQIMDPRRFSVGRKLEHMAQRRTPRRSRRLGHAAIPG